MKAKKKKEQKTTKNYNKFPLNSLIKFAKRFNGFNGFKDFSNWYSIGLNHGYYFHITHTKEFKISDKISPRDMSSMSDGDNIGECGDLMITGDLEYWDYFYNENPITLEKDIKRSYAA